jgi:hypothetical protein
LFWLKPIGLRNSSKRTSPGCIGDKFFFFIYLLLNDSLLFRHYMHHFLSIQDIFATDH